MNLIRTIFLSLSFLSLIMMTTSNAHQCSTYSISYEETCNIIPSCPQCNKVILGHNFCCNFNRFLSQHKRNYQQAFLDAAQRGYTEYLELLINLGADVDCYATVNGYNDYDGKTALMCAAQYGHVETCRLLLQLGAYVNACTNWGSTPLMWAAQFGHLNVCRLLIDAGAHVNVYTYSGNRTAYSYAKDSGHSSVCTLLVGAGATPNYESSVFSLPNCLVTGLACYGAYQLFFGKK